ncbi:MULTISPECIES: hypothetical protein [Rhodopseudomonas]|uniref:hypothetical protein n=1 Tax=Rhodopseudomonas TaxID=1073 RepID=UPI0009BA820A|nr:MULTISPECIES: hypothetical protein [Rhodopseudomonas]MDF3814352.1 hypothetical protein [Rhodopseudomonas sp. BAL398]WOK18048.1 hypothetical protein RBJ75_00545 [Rhodopseudomonas sp. BAL398]
MSHSFHSADRATHLKIVGLAASLAIVVMLVGIHGRTDSSLVASRAPIKAATTVTLSSDTSVAIR